MAAELMKIMAIRQLDEIAAKRKLANKIQLRQQAIAKAEAKITAKILSKTTKYNR